MGAGLSGAAPAQTASDEDRWVQRVHEAQSRRTPEALQAARQRIESARQAEVSVRKCRAVKSHAVRSRALAAECLTQMASSSSPEEHMAVQGRWQSAQLASRARQDQAWGKAHQAAGSALMRTAAAAAVMADASDDEEEAMQEAAQLVGAANARTMAAVGSEGLATAAGCGSAPMGALPGGSGAVDALLAQLREEPADESECTAKFLLYEGYASEVEQMRGSLLKFHAESWTAVPAAVAADMDKKVRGIDSAEAMGIPDGAREWFVFHMMRKAERNNLKMASVLEGFEKSLEFLAANSQSECPICLEAFTERGEHSAETLSCCHKVCSDCWEHWSAVTHGRPFCPLCRQDEFLGAVASRAPSAR
uniref:RING-type domain-containing protein n=1 Tax=Alexandrium catenella TaxID=2925 RepID=A0A7S1S9T5_ALECA|mmetsp:Transcript_9228/g.25001  ORF Transcript_9228/g.25001 Transcript_9228/m.25001 type:complete len:364 (+) Transcript_9228:106-1197(+)|eukprot:CAMPEP_0171172908 /NCGR_PEP_ID=MMETSP0790-20130122/9955_1 /TAXON_ID=2925 /ORGANISM="Alexandrium catenella, Strain OF101" /LENGTH=363 /DNA_ID=CAMNT_0011637767 /DNA_START=76 /DNA_END=1167 /DNA_ORIENTATION=+